MKKLLIALVATSIAIAIQTAHTYAHVLVTEQGTSLSAILHIRPDDDPIAGESSELFFDVQGTTLNSATTKLTITDESGNISKPQIDIVRNTVSANYIFSNQGVYILNLTTGDHTLRYSQRVSRGVSQAAVQSHYHQVAMFTLVLSASLLIALAITAVNRRRIILERSQ